MKVTAFKCLDNTVLMDEKEAMIRDFAIELRGVLQSKYPTLKLDRDVPISALCNYIVYSRDQVSEVMSKYRRKLHGFDQRKNNIAGSPVPVCVAVDE